MSAPNLIPSHFRMQVLLASGILGCGINIQAQLPAALVSNAVNQVRAQLETKLGKPVPSLNLLLETSNATYFASSAATPAQSVTPDTYFRFASNTKTFTATAVLHLYQQGFLNIHDKITNTIPGSAIPYVPANANWNIPYKNEITIEQLLRHSAGVYDVDNDPVPGCGGESYTAYQFALNPAHQFTVEEMVAQAAIHHLAYFKPNQGYKYSNTGYAILSEIIARVYSVVCSANKTCSDYMDEQIVGATAPVPLPAIHFPNTAADAALPLPFVPGTEYWPGDITIVISNVNASAQVGEGNGYGTMAALNRFVRTLMKGANVLSPQMVRLMQTNTAPYNADYGCACLYVTDVGYGHNGARWGYFSLMVYNPATDISAVACLPLRDFSGSDTFMSCIYAIYQAVTNATVALGYPLTPTLTPGGATNINLVANTEKDFVFSAITGVCYSVAILDAAVDVTLSLAPAANPDAKNQSVNTLDWVCPVSGTYKITALATSSIPCRLQFESKTHIGPLVTLNGLTGNGVSLSSAERLTIAVQVLNMFDYIGLPVDWWLAARACNSDLWYYLDAGIVWRPFDGNPLNCRPVYQGALNNIAPVVIAQNLRLAPGRYQVWFALDYPMDGVLHLAGPILTSSASLTVSVPRVEPAEAKKNP